MLLNIGIYKLTNLGDIRVLIGLLFQYIGCYSPNRSWIILETNFPTYEDD